MSGPEEGASRLTFSRGSFERFQIHRQQGLRQVKAIYLNSIPVPLFQYAGFLFAQSDRGLGFDRSS
jgi:hypothetical protein